MIRVLALGRCVFEVGPHRITPESDVLFALLLILTSRTDEQVSRTEILELLWPDSDERSARHRLRQAVYQLRKLGAPILVTDGGLTVRESDAELDYVVCRFDPSALLAVVAHSHPLEFLPRYIPTFSRPYASWVESERDRVRGTLRRIILNEVERAMTRHRRDEAMELARAYLELDPSHARATHILAECLAVRGDNDEALSLLDSFCLANRQAPGIEAIASLRRRIRATSRRSAAYSELDAPIVGRDDILRRIGSWIDQWRDGSRVFLLSGEPGIGKTRLLQEGVRNATLKGVPTVEYRTSINGDERPLVALLDILPLLLTLPGAVGCAPESYESLTNLSRGQHSFLSDANAVHDGPVRFAAIRRSVLDLIDALRSEGDVLVVVDDAHRLDRQTLEILIDAASDTSGRFALLLAARAAGDSYTFISSRAGATVINIPRLDATESRTILTRNLSARNAQRASHLIEWAVDLADGNPFFLAQLATHCVHDNATTLLPDSLQRSLSERIASLSPTAQLLLQASAVLAHNASFARLEVMLALPPHAIAAALAELQPTGLFAVRGSWVGCRHELIADAVIRSLGSSLETYLHRRCAIVLDGEAQTSPASSLAWDCARHWEIGQETERALATTGLLIDRLLSLGLPRAAADLCERSQRLCTTAEQESERLLRLGRALRLLHDWDGVVLALEQRDALSRRAARNTRSYSDGDFMLIEARWWRNFDGRILRQAHRRVADSRVPTMHRLQMAVIALIAADNRYRTLEAKEVIAFVESIEPTTPQEEVEFLRAKTVFHTSFGDLGTAVEASARLVEMERALMTRGSLIQSLRWQSKPLRFTNDLPAAISVLEESYRLAAHLELRHEMMASALYAVDIAVETENLQLAITWSERTAEVATGLAVSAAQRRNWAQLGARIAAMSGDTMRARALLDSARTTNQVNLTARGEEQDLAFDIYLRLADSRTVSRRPLERLRKLHEATGGGGVRDFETGVLVTALASVGQLNVARRVYDSYVVNRRSRLRYHSALECPTASEGSVARLFQCRG